MLDKIAKEDGPVLAICGGLFSYCTLANTATVFQCLGMIAAGIGAILVLMHRIYKYWQGGVE